MHIITPTCLYRGQGGILMGDHGAQHTLLGYPEKIKKHRIKKGSYTVFIEIQ